MSGRERPDWSKRYDSGEASAFDLLDEIERLQDALEMTEQDTSKVIGELHACRLGAQRLVAAEVAAYAGRFSVRAGNRPSHAHQVPGVWDDGPRGGTACEGCARWASLRQFAETGWVKPDNDPHGAVAANARPVHGTIPDTGEPCAHRGRYKDLTTRKPRCTRCGSFVYEGAGPSPCGEVDPVRALEAERDAAVARLLRAEDALENANQSIEDERAWYDTATKCLEAAVERAALAEAEAERLREDNEILREAITDLAKEGRSVANNYDCDVNPDGSWNDFGFSLVRAEQLAGGERSEAEAARLRVALERIANVHCGTDWQKMAKKAVRLAREALACGSGTEPCGEVGPGGQRCLNPNGHGVDHSDGSTLPRRDGSS